MAENYPCERNDERISNLEKGLGEIKDRTADKFDLLTRLDVIVDAIQKSNSIRDKSNAEQSKTLSHVGETLDRIDRSLISMDNRVGKLEKKFYETENLNKIDIRKIQKKQMSNFIIKYALPFGIFGILGLQLLKVFELI